MKSAINDSVEENGPAGTWRKRSGCPSASLTNSAAWTEDYMILAVRKTKIGRGSEH